MRERGGEVIVIGVGKRSVVGKRGAELGVPYPHGVGIVIVGERVYRDEGGTPYAGRAAQGEHMPVSRRIPQVYGGE